MTFNDYALIAARATVPLWANLEIPSDIAENIDAANWKAGCGLSDDTGRREVFRAKRAAFVEEARLAADLQAADDAWQADLVAAFGADAGAMRYTSHGMALASYPARNAARVAWEAVAFAGCSAPEIMGAV